MEINTSLPGRVVLTFYQAVAKVQSTVLGRVGISSATGTWYFHMVRARGERGPLKKKLRSMGGICIN